MKIGSKIKYGLPKNMSKKNNIGKNRVGNEKKAFKSRAEPKFLSPEPKFLSPERVPSQNF